MVHTRVGLVLLEQYYVSSLNHQRYFCHIINNRVVVTTCIFSSLPLDVILDYVSLPVAHPAIPKTTSAATKSFFILFMRFPSFSLFW